MKATEFKTEVLDHKGLVLVKFWNKTCTMCKILDKKLETMTLDVKMVSVDTDENMELAKEHQVRSLPTMILYKDGAVAHTLVGVPSESLIKEVLDV